MKNTSDKVDFNFCPMCNGLSQIMYPYHPKSEGLEINHHSVSVMGVSDNRPVKIIRENL